MRNRPIRYLISAAMVAAMVVRCAPALKRGAEVRGVELGDLAGRRVALDYFLGRVVVLNFVATWATVSLLDVKYLSGLHERWAARGVDVIVVVTDLEGKTVGEPLARTFGLKCRVAVATDAMRMGKTALGKISVVPTTLVLDRRLRVVHREERPIVRSQFETLIERVVKEDP